MAYLYQDIMNVPGLSGTAGQRQKQLYEKLGSPYGGYTGNYQQNIWLLNQVRNKNYGNTQPAVAPQPAPVSSPAPANNIPVPTTRTAFSEVLPFDKVFNNNLITGLAESQINPEIQRAQDSSLTNYYRQIGGSGGNRSGVALNSKESLVDNFERQRQEQVGNFVSNIKNRATDYYNQMYDRYNKNPSSFVMPTLPNYQDFIDKNPNLANMYNQNTNIPLTYTDNFRF